MKSVSSLGRVHCVRVLHRKQVQPLLRCMWSGRIHVTIKARLQEGTGMEELSQAQPADEADRPRSDAIWNIKVCGCPCSRSLSTAQTGCTTDSWRKQACKLSQTLGP